MFPKLGKGCLYVSVIFQWVQDLLGMWPSQFDHCHCIGYPEHRQCSPWKLKTKSWEVLGSSNYPRPKNHPQNHLAKHSSMESCLSKKKTSPQILQHTDVHMLSHTRNAKQFMWVPHQVWGCHCELSCMHWVGESLCVGRAIVHIVCVWKRHCDNIAIPLVKSLM